MARSQKRQDQKTRRADRNKENGKEMPRRHRNSEEKPVTHKTQVSYNYNQVIRSPPCCFCQYSTTQHSTAQHSTTQHNSHGHPHARPLCGDGALAREGFRLARRPSLLSNAAIADAIAIAITNTTQISIDAHHRLHASHYHCHYHIHATSISHATA